MSVMLKCYVYRTPGGALYLSAIKPTISESGRYYCRYPNGTPDSQKKGIPVGVDEIYCRKARCPSDYKNPRKVTLNRHLFPDLEHGEIREVIFSIFENDGAIEKMCEATGLDYDLIESKT